MSNNNECNEISVRKPDKPVKESLISSSQDFIDNLNKDNYDEEIYLQQALTESLQNAEDEYIVFQLEQIKNEDILNESKNLQDESILEDILKLSLMESKKKERNKSLENILYQLIKLKKIDVNFNENLIILEDIIKKYINCEIDNYEISLEIYNYIFNELQNIRVRENELNLIKTILLVTH
jgi:hypothetical protein